MVLLIGPRSLTSGIARAAAAASASLVLGGACSAPATETAIVLPSASPKASATGSASAVAEPAVPRGIDVNVEPIDERFVNDGNPVEWQDRSYQAEQSGSRLFAGTTSAGLALAVGHPPSDPAPGNCTLHVDMKTPPLKLPDLGLDQVFVSLSYATEDRCEDGDPAPSASAIAACKKWRTAQESVRSAIDKDRERGVEVPCTASRTGVEALVPWTELPVIGSNELGSLEIAIREPAITAALAFSPPLALAPKQSLLAWTLAHPPTMPENLAYAWRPGAPDRITYYFDTWNGSIPSAKSPETLTVDLAHREPVATLGNVVVERVPVAEPPVLAADRPLLVASVDGKFTDAIRVGREQWAVLRRGTKLDFVFAFAGNPTPRGMHDYTAAAARAVSIDTMGRFSEPWWSVQEEPPADSQGEGATFDTATVSADGRHVTLGGERLTDDRPVGRFELRYDFDDTSSAFVAKPLAKLPLAPKPRKR